MTALSVNINKLALLRNSRGRNYPDLLQFAERFIALGVHGITVHPRPDERHVKRADARE
ncbi:MAG: pyridoxine 5'-phosphate synthase, partial [Pseudohongiellaceae bacterium]